MKTTALAFFLGLAIQIWTASAEAETMIIVRGDDDYAPMEMIVDDVPTGFHIEVVNEVAKTMDIAVQWKSLPWKRALRLVESGDADAITYISRTPEREKYAIFLDGNELSSSTINFFVLKENESQYTFDGDIAKFVGNRTVLKLRGFSFGSGIDKLPSQEVNSMEQVVKMLELKRVELAILNRNDFAGEKKNHPEFRSIVALNPPVLVSRNYIAFSRAGSDETLAKRFETAYLAFRKTPRYAELVKKYGIEQ